MTESKGEIDRMVVGDCTTFKNGKQPGNGRLE